MQITFDTNNARDLAILEAFIATAMEKTNAQPQVAQNSGTTGAASTLSQPDSSVDTGAAQAAAPVTEKPKRAKKVTPVADDTSPSESEPQAPAADGPAPTIDTVRAALQSFTAAKGVPAGIELLKKYNAGRISELAEEHFASFIAECA